MTSEAIAIFARYPVPGKVKTRLAATIGDEAACSFYKQCTETVLQELIQSEATSIHLFVADVEEILQVESWMKELGMSIHIMGQLQSDNLGDRIFHSLKHLKLSGCDKVAAVATDIPDITHFIIQQALDLLDNYDIVLGPAMDGGFYFLGVKDLTKELFEDVEWSTSSVYDKMVSNAEKLMMTVAPRSLLPPIADIDTFEDLCFWICLPPESDKELVIQTAMKKLEN